LPISNTSVEDKRRAKQLLDRVTEKIAGAPAPGQRITFTQAAELYKAFRKPRAVELKRIDKVVRELGRRRIDELRHSDLVSVADRLLPGRAPATLNREVMRPCAAILHYAAENGYCGWMRVKLFEEPQPPTRPARPETMERLINVAEGRKQLLLLWLSRHGTRITQTLGITWSDVDLERAVFRLYNAKGNRWQDFPLHEEVLVRLEAIPDKERVGRVFSWGDRHNVYRWLRPLVQEFGVTFTPHMARHALGTGLNAQGAGLRTIMAALGHDDPRSSMRYQAAEIEVVRACRCENSQTQNFWDEIVSD
jgi:integrase